MAVDKKIDIGKLKVDPWNSREAGKWGWKGEDNELVKSIESGFDKDFGKLVVRPKDDGTYGIVVGSRRFQAILDADIDMEKVPCIVRDLDDEEAIVKSLKENKGRVYLTKKEKKSAIKKLDEILEEKRNSKRKRVEKIANMIGLSERMVGIYLGLIEEEEEIQELDVLITNPDEMRDEDKNFIQQVGIDEKSKRQSLDIREARDIGKVSRDKGEVMEVIEELKPQDLTVDDSREILRKVKELRKEDREAPIIDIINKAKKKFEIEEGEQAETQEVESQEVENKKKIPSVFVETDVYEACEKYCAENNVKLKVVINKALARYAKDEGWLN